MSAQAGDVWDMVHYSRTEGYQLRLGEVTATEQNFFRLRDFWTKRVYIVTNEPDEFETGADWEWLIGHGQSWVQIRVQAKILNRNGRFSELGHPHSSGQQMARLIDPNPADVTCRWLPLYVFYAAEPAAGVPVAREAGCSAQLATRVRDVYNKPPASRATLKADAHLPGSIAWARIFDGLVSRLRSGLSLADIVDDLANRPLPPQLSQISDFWDPNVGTGTCSGPLPSYVEKIVKRSGDEFDAARVVRLEVDTSKRGPRDDDHSRPRRMELESYKALSFARYNDESSAPVPSRSLTLEPSASPLGGSSLPGVVSVIDIDELATVMS